MCLYPTSEILKADKDITVFKMLEYDYATDKVKSPYRGTPYKLGETKKVRSFTDHWGNSFTIGSVPFAVHAGLHASTTKKQARADVAWNYDHCQNPSFVVECIIPKGTLYIKGHGDIVSLKLVVGRAISGSRGSSSVRRKFNGE